MDLVTRAPGPFVIQLAMGYRPWTYIRECKQKESCPPRVYCRGDSLTKEKRPYIQVSLPQLCQCKGGSSVLEQRFSQGGCWQLSLKEEAVSKPTREGNRFQAEEMVRAGSGIAGKGCGSGEKQKEASMAGAQLAGRRWCSGREQARAPEHHRPRPQSVMGYVITGLLEKLFRLTC